MEILRRSFAPGNFSAILAEYKVSVSAVELLYAQFFGLEIPKVSSIRKAVSGTGRGDRSLKSRDLPPILLRGLIGWFRRSGLGLLPDHQTGLNNNTDDK